MLVNRIRNKRKKIEKFLKKYNPIYTLSYIACFFNFDLNDNEISLLLRERIRERPILQFITGLYLKNSDYSSKKPSLKNINDLILLTVEYIDSISYLNILESEYPIFTYAPEIIRQVNPEIYPFQLEDYINKVFSKFNSYFVSKIGFSVNDAIYFWGKIVNRIEERINKLHKSRTGKDDLLNSLCRIFVINTDEFIFEENKYKKRFEKYIQTLSCKFGENKNYNTLFDKNIIFIKPLIRIKKHEYLCLFPNFLYYKIPEIFETVLSNERNNQSKIWQQFQKVKANYLEEKTYEFFTRIFPKESMYRNLKYNFEGKQYETDLLIQFDNKLLIIESKSGSLTEKAIQGDIKRIKTDLKKLVENAYMQGKRVVHYISSSKEVSFKCKSNKELKINASQFSSFYLINVTLEPLFNYATNLKELKKIGTFFEDEFPWSVYLHDLDIITRHIEFPSVFIHYLNSRMKEQKENIFHAFDELSFFGQYLANGNFKSLIDEPGNLGSVTLNGWIDIFDGYYLNNGIQPELKIEREILEIIKVLEKHKKAGFSDVVSEFLDFYFYTKKNIVELMNEKIEKTKKDHKRHNFSIINKDLNMGFSFISQYGRQGLKEKLIVYSDLMKYKTRVNKWIAIGKDVTDKEWYINEIIYWKYDKEMESITGQFFPKVEEK
jgi:hypothetical protein